MKVVAVLNCPDLAGVTRKIAIAKTFMGEEGWLHLDVTDGIFSKHRNWHDSAEWLALHVPFNLEVHLMVQNPHIAAEEWLKVGAKRIVVHVETLTDEIEVRLHQLVAEYDAELMLACIPETPAEAIIEHMRPGMKIQVLAVHPGPAAQPFERSVVPKIRTLRDALPDVTIEIDGGMDFENAKVVREAGADMVASGTYIFESETPQSAYEILKSL